MYIAYMVHTTLVLLLGFHAAVVISHKLQSFRVSPLSKCLVPQTGTKELNLKHQAGRVSLAFRPTPSDGVSVKHSIALIT
jgi:hypothetical protein